MTSTCVHHCGIKIDYFFRNWVFHIISNCRCLNWYWFLCLLYFRKLRNRDNLLKCNVGLLSSRRFWWLLLYFLLFFRSFFGIFFGSFLCLFSFFLSSFSFLLSFFLIPIEFSFCNEFCYSHWIIPVNEFLIVLLINLNRLASQR